jgi:hypothetical protein
VVGSAWGAVLPIEAGKESVVPRNRLRRNVSQSSDPSEADCPATGFVSKKLSAFADGWVRRRSGIRVRPASSNSRRRGYNSMLRTSLQAKMLGKAMIVMAEIPGFGRMDQSTATQAVT